MPALIVCPKCSRKLRVPENLMGKKVKCPSCGTAFTAAEAEEDLPTAPLIEEKEAPSPARRKATPPPAPKEQIEEKASKPRRRPAPPPQEDEEDETQAEDSEEEPRPRRRRRPVEAEDEEEEDEEEDRPKRKKSGKRGWTRVRTGVTLVLVSICILIGSAIIGLIGGMIVGASTAAALNAPPGPGRPPVAPVVTAGAGMLVLAAIIGVLAFASHVSALVGYAFCLGAPPKFGAKGLAITTFALGGASLVLAVFAGIIAASRGAAANLGVGMAAAGPGGVLNMISSFLDLAKFFTFLFFIMAVAKCLRAYDLEKTAKNLTILSGVGLVGAVVWIVLTLVMAGAMVAGANQQGGPSATAGASAIAMIGCSCAMIVVGLVAFVWYILVLVQTRGELTSYLRRRRL